MHRNRGTMRGMGAISRYIFWTTFGAFLVVPGSLTAVIWVTLPHSAPISLGCYRCNTPLWSPPADRFNVLTEHITQRFATS